MEFIQQIWTFFIEFLTDTQTVLNNLINTYDTLVYAILFVVIFCETGLVVTPFLPGDSLIFLAATLTANPNNHLHVWWLVLILIAAAVLGDAANYTIGKYFGKWLFRKPDSKIFKQAYLEKTHQFYEKHGAKTIIIARFVPIVRTFAPFVAGMGSMSYLKFFSYNVLGGVAWVTLFSLLGYFFGNLSFIQNHLSLVALIIIILSLMPAVYEVLKSKMKNAKKQKKTA